jgi:hypothetical protein
VSGWRVGALLSCAWGRALRCDQRFWFRLLL